MLSLPLIGLLAAVPNDAWYGSAQVRLDLQVAAGDAGIPAGYAFRFSFDHASLVGRGQGQASGSDLAAAVVTDAGLFEAVPLTLDTGSTTGLSNCQVWFRLPRALASNSVAEVSIFSGVSVDAGTFGSADRVFLFADDFTTGNFSKWVVGVNQPSLAVVDGGFNDRFAALSRPLGTMGDTQQLFAAVGQTAEDVELDCWVRFSSVLSAQAGWFIRALPPPVDSSLNFGPDAFAGPYWSLGYRLNSGFTRDTDVSLSVTNGSWARLRYFALGSQHRGCVGASCTPLTNTGSPLVRDGGVGWGRYFLNGDFAPDGGRDIWFDAVRVRPLVANEPVAVAGKTVLGFNEPCSGGSNCRFGLCDLMTGRCPVPDAGVDAGAPDSGAVDAGAPDAGPIDAGVPDSGMPDAGTIDAAVLDGGPGDASVSDASVTDASVSDASVTDASVTDASVTDASVADASVSDASVSDANVSDASVSDASIPDASMPATQVPLIVSCDCNSGADSRLLVVAIAVLLLRRRR